MRTDLSSTGDEIVRDYDGYEPSETKDPPVFDAGSFLGGDG